MRPVSHLVVHAINRGMVEPMGTFGGCANCHTSRAKSQAASDPHEANPITIADDTSLVSSLLSDVQLTWF